MYREASFSKKKNVNKKAKHWFATVGWIEKKVHGEETQWLSSR